MNGSYKFFVAEPMALNTLESIKKENDFVGSECTSEKFKLGEKNWEFCVFHVIAIFTSFFIFVAVRCAQQADNSNERNKMCVLSCSQLSSTKFESSFGGG